MAICEDFSFGLPGWLREELRGAKREYKTPDERMGLALRLAAQNIDNGLGGPFGACVFQANNGLLLSVGVNLVTALSCSVLHAEMVAIMLAQRKLGTYNMKLDKGGPCELVSSTEPCAMCLGAIHWAGLSRLVCGARGEDAEAIGFDEGRKPVGGTMVLEEQGIQVVRDCRREEAISILTRYQEMGGKIY